MLFRSVFPLGDRRLRTVEFAARQELFAKHIEAVRKAATTVQ